MSKTTEMSYLSLKLPSEEVRVIEQQREATRRIQVGYCPNASAYWHRAEISNPRAALMRTSASCAAGMRPAVVS